ncbi:beta-lactamase family protein [Sphingomonas cannabina]|uniref:serine hydrolase domain-containing protein n=1 Tax=Sphingomonas cannabina TaxID=2899123 RepID=UPI001F436CCD|nr:serine hydrolase domain-containing protein [Sphingomonas cannabina]UIJ45775.1 beta-lactamase family protein [Sphingomonas cannabina]
MGMRLAAAILLAGSVTASAWARQAQPAPAPAPAVQASIGRYPALKTLVDRYVAEGKTNGIVVAIGEGSAPPTFLVAGTIAAEPGSEPAGPDSLWRVYSMTKPITAMAAMMLIEDGRMSLDQPISDFIPAFKDMKVLTDPANSLAARPAARPITIRHLLTHTAGLGYTIVTKGPLLEEYNRLGIVPGQVDIRTETEARKARPASLQEFANRVASLPLIADPGTEWSYSIALDVMGAVIEKASGMTFDAFVQKRILGPLKMTSTFWQVPAADVGRLASNYAWVGDNRVPIDPAATSVYLQKPSFPYGGAGLVMSARDYDRFLQMLLNEGEVDGVRVMKPETVRLAMSNLLPPGVTFGGVGGNTGGDASPEQGYGAGGSVYLRDVPGGASKGTYGWGGAAGTVAWVDPVRKVRGTVMVNYFPSDKWPLRADVVKALYADRP